MQERAEAMHIGISYSVGLGNRSDISEIDLLQFFENDPDTKCIAIYLESFHDGRRFLELARRISVSKPIIAIKAGSTEAGSRAATSHTGALSKGSDAIVDGALKQAGVIRARDDEELIDYSNALGLMSATKGNRVAYVGSAGGVGVMISDYIEGSGLEPPLKMTMLSDKTKHALHKILQEFAPVGNPVDLTASSTPRQYDDAMRLVLQDSSVDLLILSIDMQPPMMGDEVFEFIPDWIKFGKPIIGTSTGGGTLACDAILKMQALGIPSFPSLSRCVKAAKALYQRGLFLKKVM
jgi:acyl-CoA synthetase (NDP forming)